MTSVRNTWGDPEILALGKEIETGKVLGPHIYSSGPVTDGSPAEWHGSRAVVPKTNPRIVFGMRLRELRLAKGISQEKLAEVANLHRDYVGVLERGGQSPSLDAICKLALALKVKAGDLLANLP